MAAAFGRGIHADARLGDEELLQIVEQRLCCLEVSSVKSFGKPAIDGRYEISRLPAPMAAPYPTEAERGRNS
jgi:hypothetical protein